MVKQTVYVVDDDVDVRDSLQWLLESVGLTVAAFDNAQAFLDSFVPGTSGCIVMDVRMPGLSGISAQKQLPDYQVDLPLIMISGHGSVNMAVTAMTQGARTFIEKPFNDQLLLDHVQQALAQDLAQRSSQQKRQAVQQHYAALTKRERQVFEQVAQGLGNQDIADVLGISRKTVEGHRANLMSKMAAQSLSELIQMAISLGLMSGYADQ
ncbi:response regulator [Amphritea sp. 2_MG-2023]|jgi:two-component system response regulator TtrR|uniref:response regulator transcription factor n=1 Tax=Amphritea TaxID=515417 RepID=UPI001C066F58|nr:MULTISPECIES: response regulator [Amphritea]MBU2965651.1 response regulator [Amphritea atlantica]MDO6417207.1 response regulator [Amphritea sp. 2_MG-2023]